MAEFTIVGITGNLTRPSKTRALVGEILRQAASVAAANTKLYDVVDAGLELDRSNISIRASITARGGTAMFSAIRVSDRISVGGQPSEADLDRLAERGFRAVIDLRTDDEANLPISPEAERRYEESVGLAYRRLPIRPAGVKPHEVEAFRAIARDLPVPIFVHCAAGQRASAVSVLAEGVGDTADASLLDAARQGIAFPERNVEALIRQCFGQG